jgi:hypothetical protein
MCASLALSFSNSKGAYLYTQMLNCAQTKVFACTARTGYYCLVRSLLTERLRMRYVPSNLNLRQALRRGCKSPVDGDCNLRMWRAHVWFDRPKFPSASLRLATQVGVKAAERLPQQLPFQILVSRILGYDAGTARFPPWSRFSRWK